MNQLQITANNRPTCTALSTVTTILSSITTHVLKPKPQLLLPALCPKNASNASDQQIHAPRPPQHLQPRTRQRYHILKLKTHAHLHMPPNTLETLQAPRTWESEWKLPMLLGSVQAHVRSK